MQPGQLMTSGVARLRATMVFFFSVVLIHCVASGGRTAYSSDWDRELPKTAIRNVFVAGESDMEIWDQFCERYGVRSILVVTDPEQCNLTESKPVSVLVSVTSGTVADFYDRFCKEFHCKWAQDTTTGVTWIFPDTMTYDALLTMPVTLRPSSGIPMGAGVLDRLTDDGLIVWQSPWPMDDVVEIATEVHTLKDAMNSMCESSPYLTFAVCLKANGLPLLIPDILPNDEVVPRPGDRLLSRLELGSDRITSPVEYASAFASPNPRLRHFVYHYFFNGSRRFNFEKLFNEAVDPEVKLGIAIAISKYSIQSEDLSRSSSPPEIAQTIRALLSRDDLLSSNPQVYASAALEELRTTGNTAGLERFAARRADAVEILNSILPSVQAALHGVGQNRDPALRKKNRPALLASDNPLRGVAEFMKDLPDRDDLTSAVEHLATGDSPSQQRVKEFLLREKAKLLN